MPQLDTIYMVMTYLWTWCILYMMTKKIKTFLMKMTPKKEQMKMNTPTNTMPW